jgi:integrin beta 1
MTFNIVLVIIGISALSSAQFSYREDPASSLLLGQNPCVSKQTCSECMQTPTCAWCMQPDYLSADGSPLSRCNQEEFFQSAMKKESKSQCVAKFVVNPNNMYTILQNVELRKSSSYEEAVQVKPQHVQLSMRVNEPYNMDFFYEQAIDYPVDLYYLMDLSKSMEDDKEKLSALGDLLAEAMQSLTSNFKLGFGSFVDKVVMPYVSTVPRKL